jgi:hypothetical protein
LVSLSLYLLEIIMADLDQRDAAPDWSGLLVISPMPRPLLPVAQ